MHIVEVMHTIYLGVNGISILFLCGIQLTLEIQVYH